MISKQDLIKLGLKHKFLNYIDHETPRNYFPHHIDRYKDTYDVAELHESVTDLYTLLAAIYDKVDIV